MVQLLAWVPVVLCGVASVIDLRTREIPDWIPVVVIVSAPLAALLGWAGPTWAEMGVGLVVLAVLAVAAFAFMGFGGGDAKLMIALGPWVGLRPLLLYVLAVAIMGGVLGLIAAARKQKTLAYGPAIAVGILVVTISREVVPG